MQKDTIQNIFLGLLVGGVILLSGGMFFLYRQMQSVSQSVRQTESTPAPTAPTRKDEAPSPVVQQKTLLLEEANAKLMELIAMEEAGNWKYQYKLSDLQAEPLRVAERTLHLPYDSTWGNDRYQLDTYEEVNGTFYFGPMYVSEMHGAYRTASVRIIDGRTLDAALADPSYTTKDCSGQETFKPAKVKVGNVDTVRFEGEACEAIWVGYEIQLGNKNAVISSQPDGNEDLVRWVLERM